jgi:HlyD family secretion protein
MNRWAIMLPLIVLAAGCEVSDSPFPLVGTLERDRIEIPAQAWEVLVDIAVKEGEEVEPGQLLAHQESALAEARVEQAKATEQRAARRLAELERGPRAEEIRAARARLEGAEGQLVADDKALMRVTDLVARGLLSDSDLDDARARAEVTKASRDAAAAQLSELVTGTTVEELDQARADLEAAAASLAQQTLELDRLELRAPVAGVIDSIPYKLGDRPPAGATVMVLLADTAPYARTYVPEAVRAMIHPGMSASISVDGIPGPIPGRVRTVSSDAVFTPYFALTERDRSRLVYVAEITLIGDDVDRLPTGLPAEVSFPDLADLPSVR